MKLKTLLLTTLLVAPVAFANSGLPDGAVQMTGDEIKAAAMLNQVYKGDWTYKGDTGTFETHRCADGTRYGNSNGGAFKKTKWKVKKDRICRNEDGKKKCVKLYKLPNGQQYSTRNAGSELITGMTTEIGPSDKCSS